MNIKDIKIGDWVLMDSGAIVKVVGKTIRRTKCGGYLEVAIEGALDRCVINPEYVREIVAYPAALITFKRSDMKFSLVLYSLDDQKIQTPVRKRQKKK